MESGADDRASLRNAWIAQGRLVVQEDNEASDQDAIYKWRLNFLDAGTEDLDYGAICHLVYHSRNYHIPGRGLQRLRLELIDMAGARIAREADSCDPEGEPIPTVRTGP